MRRREGEEGGTGSVVCHLSIDSVAVELER